MAEIKRRRKNQCRKGDLKMKKYQNKQWQFSIDDYELAEKLEKAYQKHGVNINIMNWKCFSNYIIYKVKLKGSTRETQLHTYAKDVQLRLKVPVFQVIKEEFNIFIIISDEKMEYQHLPQIVLSKEYIESVKSWKLPYIVGNDATGKLIVEDLSEFPHLLVAGASNSGKTVGLQSLLISLSYCKSPRKINLILIDVGAMDLIPFNGIPHLSCPVIRDRETAYRALAALMDEMERRIEIQMENMDQFNSLPQIVLVIDEFQAFFVGMEDKQAIRMAVNVISGLLQRGRHAKIHVVLAAQNPTVQNMKVDLGNITARVAFKCAKRNYSETILGEGGAENLSGQGDMLFKSPKYAEPKRIQGIYISEQELQKMLIFINMQWNKYSLENRFKFVIQEEELQKRELASGDRLTAKTIAGKGHINMEDKLFAEIMLWTLKQDAISCNMLMGKFNLGWNRANRFIERLYDLNIVGGLDAKLPRAVLPHSAEDLSPETTCLLEQNGFDLDQIKRVFLTKKEDM